LEYLQQGRKETPPLHVKHLSQSHMNPSIIKVISL